MNDYFGAIISKWVLSTEFIVLEQNCDKVPADIRATSEAVLAGMVGTLVAGTFLTFGFTWPIYILAALILATAQWVDRHVKPKQN